MVFIIDVFRYKFKEDIYISLQVYVKMVYGNFIGRTPYKTTSTQDGGMFSGVPWVSGLIEGKGRYFNQQTGIL